MTDGPSRPERDSSEVDRSVSLEGRVALVSGAAGDLGRATAIRLAAAGATVVLCDLPASSDSLAETARRCEAVGSTDSAPLEITFDVTDHGAVVDAVASATESVGPPDAVFNNAGYQGAFANLTDYPADDFARVLAVNVTGVFSVLQACAQVLQTAEQPGAIVNTASMAATGAPNMAAYGASKAAVIGLTRTAALDLAPAGIRVNAISPAFIGPGMMWDRQVELQASVPSQYYGADVGTVADQMLGQIPLRRYGTVDEVASTVEFLLSDSASYLTGINIEISGGIG